MQMLRLQSSINYLAQIPLVYDVSRNQVRGWQSVKITDCLGARKKCEYFLQNSIIVRSSLLYILQFRYILLNRKLLYRIGTLILSYTCIIIQLPLYPNVLEYRLTRRLYRYLYISSTIVANSLRVIKDRALEGLYFQGTFPIKRVSSLDTLARLRI